MILLLILLLIVGFIITKLMADGIIFAVFIGVVVIVYLYKAIRSDNYNKKLFFRCLKLVSIIVGGSIGLMIVLAFIRAYTGLN